MRVTPDIRTITRRFDYLVPEDLRDQVRVGTPVRVRLRGRRVGGWVTDIGTEPPAGTRLSPLAKVSGHGPPPELVALADWAAWRWAGSPSTFLRTASPPAVVTELAPPPGSAATPLTEDDELITVALDRQRAVLRLPPAADRYPLVLAAAARPGDTLVLVPSLGEAHELADRLRRSGAPVACVAHDRPGRAAAGEWARAAAGGVTVVGTRAGAWAPVGALARVVVLDEHDEAYQGDQAPTWHAREVALERAGRAGAGALFVSPCPSLDVLAAAELVTPNRSRERRGWPAFEIVDRRDEDPAQGGLFSARVAALVRGGGRVVAVLNRTGRSRLLACGHCGHLARCERCTGALVQPGRDELVCRRCGSQRPVVCASCGAGRFRNLRAGVARAAEELAALAGEPVGEVTATSAGDPGSHRVVVGTEAVLRRAGRADVVVFLDLDQELAAPRFRAGEEAMALLSRAARLVRGRTEHGRVVAQTRQPDHPVLDAALHGDPDRATIGESLVREALGLPPASALALVSGEGAAPFAAGLSERPGLLVDGPSRGTWRVRAPDHTTLCDALAGVERPPEPVRVAVDPTRI